MFTSDEQISQTSLVLKLQKNSGDAVRRLGTIIQSIFLPNQEPPFAWPFRHGVVSLDTQGFFRSCLETFVAPFLPTLATDCPCVSKVDWCSVSNTMSISTSADKQNQWPNRILTRAAVKLRSHGNPAVPTSWVDADVNGFERSDKLMINYGMTICVSVEYLKKITNKRNNLRFWK